MNAPTPRQLALVLAGVLTTAMIAAGIYGLASGASGERDRSEDPFKSQDVVGPSVEGATMDAALSVPALPRTSDPVMYARAVAEALFAWDTTSGLLPTDYTAPVLADADPSGEEVAGLLADVPTFVPTTDQWLALADMEVAQTLTISSAAVPASWTQSLEQSRGRLRPGTSAVTITGVRSRTGVWDREPVQTMSEVSFTVFVACPPAFARCRILRLSQLDNPLL
ncbi:hypothetical protein KDN32_12235 [Nocardioides sp. J2M5]|uniref:hypothetical protein n=1 Tax=Nocardioides palaemonis TaxID=2829810 RepID=UPI001BA847FD|nr:hypothetical protein [Nocardioides palaemonis]MBS2938511.1 hypothetical protein [Nocardioides palaemonis]